MMRDHVKRNMTGTNPNIQKINQAIILNYPFPVEATLHEQQRIVAYLDSLQDKINGLKQLQKEIAAELDAVLPAILDRAFKGEL
jgi:type I restriction enzyme S subunit